MGSYSYVCHPEELEDLSVKSLGVLERKEMKTIMYQGEEKEVKLIAYAGKAAQVIFRENRFNVYINNKLTGSKTEQEAAKALRTWMIEEAFDRIQQRTAVYSEIIGVQYNSIRIKDTKTRWGSCSSKGNLNFNFRIIMAPAQVMDYIIVHELCHLKHMNHSKEFWSTVAGYMPDYTVHKEWLKTKVARLYQI